MNNIYTDQQRQAISEEEYNNYYIGDPLTIDNNQTSSATYQRLRTALVDFKSML
ncbi:hypothetical protein MKL26_06815 [Streptococcus suis]|nr:hypothetical protein [Streptococcus suis]